MPRCPELDREVASLYREAKSRVMPAAMDVLKNEQKEWLGKREKCKASATTRPRVC